MDGAGRGPGPPLQLRLVLLAGHGQYSVLQPDRHRRRRGLQAVHPLPGPSAPCEVRVSSIQVYIVYSVFVDLFICLFFLFIIVFIHSFIHLFIHSFILSFIHLFLYNQKEFRLKIFYFEFKWLSSRYIFQVKTSLQSSSGMVVGKELHIHLFIC